MFQEKLLLGRQWRSRQSRYWWRDPRPGYNLQGRTPGPWLYNLHAGCWLLLATHWPSSLQLCAWCDGAAPGLTPGAWCRDTDASRLAPGKIIFGSSEWSAVLHLASRFYTQLKIYSPHPYSIQTPYLWDLLGLTKTKCFTSITFRRPHLDRIKTALYTRMQELKISR